MSSLSRFIVFLLFSQLIVGKTAIGQLYNFHNYSVEHGIAQSQVYSMIQDKRGLLWFGTRGGGLTRYDGLKFKTFTERDGLVNNYIYDILEDPQGNLWISTNDGISHYNGKKFSSYKPKEKSSPTQVLKTVLDRQQKLWMATSHGLMTFDGKSFENISKKLKLSPETINSVIVDRDGNIWFGDGQGLYQIIRLENGMKLINYMTNAITCILQDKEGSIWIGTYGDGAYRFDGKNFTRFDDNQELYKKTILDIFIDDKKQVWLGTLYHGVINYQPQTRSFTMLGESEGLSNNHVRKIIQDNTGSYWFGTSGGGVCNYFGKQFTTYDRNSGLGGSFIYSIYRDSKDRLWIGNSQKGVSVMENGTFANYHSQNGFADVKVKAILEGWDGEILLGTEGKGVFGWKDSVFTELGPLVKAYIRGMVKDKEDNIWIATAGRGLYKLQRKDGEIISSNFLVSNGLLSNRLTTLWCDKKGNIWYGTENDGVGCLNSKSNHLLKLTVAKGLSSNTIRSISEDGRGYIWIGTAGSGVNAVRLDEPQKKPVVFNDVLTSANVYLLTFDKQNNLIVGTEKGLDYIQLTKDLKVRSMKHYSKGDGFTGVETCQNSVFRDKDGTLWFGTINGLIRFNPSSLNKNQIPPIIRITDVELFYKPLQETSFKRYLGDWNLVKNIDLPYDQNHVSFKFFAVNLSNPEGVRYQWKLEGFDENWSPISADDKITYSNLNPGTYRFLVHAFNEDGVRTADPSVVIFTIATPFWYRWWFMTSIAAVIVLIIYLLVRRRFQQLKRKSEEERMKLQMEKDIVELEQKALRLQMNPHFIFNALNSIQSQIGTGNDKEGRYYLAKFSRLMRQILDNSRNTTITLQEEISTLENYLLIEEFCNGNRFEYTITVPENMETDFVRIPPMMIQPFVENAIKHGFRDMDGLGKKGMITIEFTEEKEAIICTVADNGIGRERSAELNKASKETYHRSTALLVTQERLDKLSEESDKLSLEIIDLYDGDQPSGTKVIIRIPTI